jgi:rhodanese-related sulfurtransferase
MESMKPSWLSKTDYVKNFIEYKNDFIIQSPNDSNVQLELELGKKHTQKKILYWAANEKLSHSPIIQDVKKAYHHFENHGVASINKNGLVKLEFKCPQLYTTHAKNKSKSKTYFRHLHFVFANKEETRWEPQIYTKIIVCKLEYKAVKKMLDTGLYVFINALPSEYYAKDHIPRSYNLFHKTIKSMSVDELQQWFREIVELHYPKLKTYLQKNRIDVYELPIVTYCANSKCNASELAIEELMKKGFVNIHEYTGGMKDYRSMNPFDKA